MRLSRFCLEDATWRAPPIDRWQVCHNLTLLRPRELPRVAFGHVDTLAGLENKAVMAQPIVFLRTAAAVELDEPGRNHFDATGPLEQWHYL
jgi:hypothetical protein